jgi:pentose-5-phosphate-3-epimerase
MPNTGLVRLSKILVKTLAKKLKSLNIVILTLAPGVRGQSLQRGVLRERRVQDTRTKMRQEQMRHG